MKELLPLTPEEFARARRRLLDPAPGGEIEAARRFGVDLTLLVERLRLTPAERVRELHEACAAAGGVRGAASRRQR